MSFYARYVPQQNVSTATQQTARPAKRKREEAAGRHGKKKDKKRKLDGDAEGAVEKHVGHDGTSKATHGVHDRTHVNEPITRPGRTRIEHSILDESGAKAVKGADVVSEPAQEPTRNVISNVPNGRKPKRPKTKHTDQPEAKDTAADDYHAKHASVLSKFSKSKAKGNKRKEGLAPVQTEPPQETHGLEPIPQPVDPVRENRRQSHHTLPTWQRDAVKVIPSDTKPFSEFGLSDGLVDNLQTISLERTLPIQTAVLPLLLHGEESHNGDVCVSATTGSGKTLAYIVPVIEDLKQYSSTKLRAVIVVPTRELVKQVRQLCESCIVGTSLKVAAAAGTKTLKEEQTVLVAQEDVYDPEAYTAEQTSPIDWSNLSIEKVLAEAQSRTVRSLDHVTRFNSKVDILITTPGRLVDHVQSTPGFNLDYVTWLVVDEADRLLNESYQEWVDTVVPALQSQKATKNRDHLLSQMRMKVPAREVKKVLLSATMTADISKLNSLGLINPKLVVLSGHKAKPPDGEADIEADLDEQRPDHCGEFHLPETLSEVVVPVRESSEKPLYLLQTLQKLGIFSTLSNTMSLTNRNTSSQYSDSDTGSDSSSAESTSSSGSSSVDDSNSIIQDCAEDVDKQPSSRALIFTRSTASVERLSRLLSLLSPNLAPHIATLTRSTASSSSSRQSLQAFCSGRTSILIATDRASRGLDIPDLENVISYDVPSSALTYVHRVGRTARAGKEGTAWTLVEHREGAWFWREIGGKEGKDRKGAELRLVRKKEPRKVMMEIDDEDEDVKRKYEEALKQLGEEVKGTW